MLAERGDPSPSMSPLAREGGSPLLTPEGSTCMLLPFASTSGPSHRGHPTLIPTSQPHSKNPNAIGMRPAKESPVGNPWRGEAAHPMLAFLLSPSSRSGALLQPGGTRAGPETRQTICWVGTPGSAQAWPSILTSTTAPGCCQGTLQAGAERSSRRGASGSAAPQSVPGGSPQHPQPQNHPCQLCLCPVSRVGPDRRTAARMPRCCPGFHTSCAPLGGRRLNPRGSLPDRAGHPRGGAHRGQGSAPLPQPST